MAEKLLRAFDWSMEVEGYPWKVGVTIGVSVYPEDGSDLESLLADADRAMYRARGRGTAWKREPS